MDAYILSVLLSAVGIIRLGRNNNLLGADNSLILTGVVVPTLLVLLCNNLRDKSTSLSIEEEGEDVFILGCNILLSPTDDVLEEWDGRCCCSDCT